MEQKKSKREKKISCLSQSHRISKDSTFKDIFKNGKRWHTPSFVAYFKPSNKLQLAFVASKKVGNAVKRNLAKRRLRALALLNEQKQHITLGQFVFVAKVEISDIEFNALQKDFSKAINRIQN